MPDTSLLLQTMRAQSDVAGRKLRAGGEGVVGCTSGEIVVVEAACGEGKDGEGG